MTNDIEDRLRATLVAEAERHAVTPDLEALRARRDGSDRAVVDLHLSPRRNRARILAAAIVLAVLALAAAGVVRSGSDGGDEPVASGTGASGYYLPGPGWDIVGLEVPSTLDRGATREVTFVPADDAVGDAAVRVLVVRAASLAGATEAWEAAGATPLERAAGEPRIWLVETPNHVEADGTTGSRLLMPAGDEVLVVSGSDARLDAMVDLADTWRSTRGRQIAVSGPTDLVRGLDITYRDPVPVDAGPLAADGAPPPAEAQVPLVLVTVEDDRGARATYSLGGPDATGRPTGVGDEDGGADRGVEYDALARPVTGLRDDGDVWQVPRWGPTAPLFALLPAADVAAAAEDLGGGRAGATSADLRDLVGGLRPVDGAAWAAAVADLADGARDWPARLADVDPTGGDEGSATTFAEVGEPIAETITETTEGGDEPPDVLPPSAPDPASATGPLQELADPGPDSDRLPAAFAEAVTVGFVGSTDADVVLTGDDRFDPSQWVLDVGGRWGQVGPASALDRFAGGPIEATSPGSPTPRCAAASGPAEGDLVTLTPEGIESCLDWFAIVVRIDDRERISEVRLALWEP